MVDKRLARITLLSAAALLTWPLAALAADPSYPDDGIEVEEPDRFDVAFGFAVVSDYIDEGITQTNHSPALQGYIEPSYGIFYAGAWASNVEFEDETDTEVNLYAGIRPEFGRFAFDVGYLYAFYIDDIDDPEGEVYAGVEFAVSDALSVETEVSWAHESSDYSVEGGAELELMHGWSVSGGLGYAAFDDPDEIDYLHWNAGLSWTRDPVTVDFRYYDTELNAVECFDMAGAADACDARFVAKLSVDTSILSLRGNETETGDD